MWPRHRTSCPALPALAPLPAIPQADRSPSTFWGAIQWPRRATRVVPAATREAANPTSYADFPAPTTTTRLPYKAGQRGAAHVHRTQHGGLHCCVGPAPGMLGKQSKAFNGVM